MALFSRFKSSKTSKKQADGAKQEEVVAKVPYKHVPSHAAQDSRALVTHAERAADKPVIRREIRKLNAAVAISERSSRTSRTSSVSNNALLGSAAESIRESTSTAPHPAGHGSPNAYRSSWTNLATMDVEPGPVMKMVACDRALTSYNGTSYGRTKVVDPADRKPSPLSSELHLSELGPTISRVPSHGSMGGVEMPTRPKKTAEPLGIKGITGEEAKYILPTKDAKHLGLTAPKRTIFKHFKKRS